MANTGSRVYDHPEQDTMVESASKPFPTIKTGVVYNKEITREAKDYVAGEGSMGWERNQMVKRDGWLVDEMELKRIGQHKMDKLKTYGSYAI